MDLPCFIVAGDCDDTTIHMVRQLRAIFEMNVDAPDKSTKFFPHVAYCVNLTFLVGTSLFAFVYGRCHGFKMAAM